MDGLADPTGLITDIFNSLAILFPGVKAYLSTALLCFASVSGICAAITRYVPAPTTASWRWWVRTYLVINYLAFNRGHAVNAAPPGMQPEARDAALQSARATATAPARAPIAADPAAKSALNQQGS